MRIVPKVILLVSLSVGTVMVGLSYVGTSRMEEVMLRETGRMLSSDLDFAAGTVLDRTQGVTRTSEIIASDPAIYKALYLEVSAGINQNLNRMVAIYPFFKYIMIVDPNGSIFAVNTQDNQGRKIAGEELLGLNFRENPLYIQPSEKRTTVGTPGPDPYLEILGVKGGMNRWFITPVLSRETLVGWVVVSHDWQAEMTKVADDITRQLTDLGHPVIGTGLIDEDGNVVMGTCPSRERAERDPNIICTERPVSFGKRRMMLVIAVDKSKAMQPVTRLKGFFLMAGAFAAALLATLLYLVLRKTLLSRLAVVQAGTRAFREGDLSYRLPSLGNDELGELSNTFNEMGESLQKVHADLKIEKEQLALTLETAPVGIVTVDFQGRVLTANRAYCKMLGYSIAELQGMSVTQLTHPDDVEETLTAIQEIRDGTVQIPFLEKRYVRKDSSIRFGIVQAGVIRDDQGRPAILVAGVEDVTERKEAQEALRESEERYRCLVENIDLGITLIDSSHTIVMTNTATSKWLNIPTSESKGKKCYRVFHGREAVCPYCPGVRAMTTGRTSSSETGRVRDDGTEMHVFIRAFPVWGQDGEAIGFIEVVEDITERRRVERDLIESEQRFRAVFENDHVVMLLIDPDTGRIVDGSPGACAFYGYEREELKKKTIPEISTLPSEEVFENIRGGMSQQCSFFYSSGRRASGELRDVEVYAGPIVVGGKTLLFSVVHDVTDRKLAESLLRQSEERSRLLVEESPIGIGIVQDGALAYANPALLTTFGLGSPEEAVGRPVDDFIDVMDRERLLQSQKDRLEGREAPPYLEASGIRKNGERFDMTVWPRLIDYLGEPAILFFLADTSESKALRSQLVQAQKMEAIGTLAGGIAHDFNNLLTIILGYSEIIIAEKDKSDQDYEDLRKVKHAARSAGDMVQQILAFSRKTETKPRPINLSTPLEQLQKMLSRLIPRIIEIRIDLNPDTPIVYADPAQIEQVIINLAVNARDAMPTGGVLTIKTQPAFLNDAYCRSHVGAKKGWNAVIEVGDNGVGIEPAGLDRIFEPFYTTKKPGQGTGLGLATVYGIVQAHGGHITCRSQVGHGTTFKIFLPAHGVEADSDMATSQEFPIFGEGTILLVDDEEYVRELGRKILTGAGYTVITAADGREAVETYIRAKDRISLVILDLIMPIMDGHQCLREIRRIDPGAKVLIVSGLSDTGTSGDTSLTGSRGFVRKPFDLKVLLKAVRDALTEK